MECSECYSYCERTRSRSVLRARKTFSRCCVQLSVWGSTWRPSTYVRSRFRCCFPSSGRSHYSISCILCWFLIWGFIQVGSKIPFIKWLLIGSDIQERALQKMSGREVGKILLFFGCRDPELDYLYSEDDLAEWIKLGVVDVHPAFSRCSEVGAIDCSTCIFLNDIQLFSRFWVDRDDVVTAFNSKA